MMTQMVSSNVGWYWNRLRCMSVGEVAYRVRQKLSAQAERVGMATAQRVATPDWSTLGNPFIALDAGVNAERYVVAADELLAGRLSVFNRRYEFQGVPEWNRDPKTGRVAPLSFGKTLDYRDEAQVGDIKYLWEPNRHLHLVTLAQAYHLTREPQYLEAVGRHISSWLDQCPYLLGANWTSSLELGIRLINWSLVWQLIGGRESELFRDNAGQALRHRWLESVFQHMHFIRGHFSRFSSANNHLIGEASGLYVATTTWPYWPETRQWRRAARRELLREALIQNAPDGVNREQAISYQQFVADFLLFAALAGRANGDEFPAEYWQRLERMAEFIAALMDVGGNVPMIGDADDGYVTALAAECCPYRSLLATAAVLFGRADFKGKAGAFDDKSRWLLGQGGERVFAGLSRSQTTIPRVFADGGYYVLGGDFETSEEIRIVVDAGPLGYQRIAAHGHADALAFTLSYAGIEFLIDPGTYAYHTERRWRDYFRGTAAHNTVRVDAENQSVIGGSFMWTEHAHAECHVWQSNGQVDRFVGSHDGYRRLADPVRHARELIFDKTRRYLAITDVLECRADHEVERFWHFAEDVQVTIETDGIVRAEKDGRAIRLIPQTPPASARIYRGDTSHPSGWISRRFDVKVPSTTVVWQDHITASCQLRLKIERV